MKAQNTIDVHNLALDLLDFCGGDVPTQISLQLWKKRRGYTFTPIQDRLILQTSEYLVTNP